MTNNEPKNGVVEKALSWAILAATVLGTILIRLRLAGVPLERDEGEYAYVGQLILQGIPPYLTAYSMKFPGIYFVYAAIMSVFGQTAEGIHLGLILVNAGTTVLLFLVARRLFDPLAAAAVSASFALLGLSRSMLGLAANTEHFLLLPMMVGLLMMMRACDSGKRDYIALSGLCFGLAFVIKQPGVFFGAMAAVYIFLHFRQVKHFLLFLAGFITPFAATVLYLDAAKAFDKFWFWTMAYAHSYISISTLSHGFFRLINNTSYAVSSFRLLWIAALAGFVCLFMKRTEPGRRNFLLLFSAASALALMPGFYFRQHYYILILPAVSLLIGLAINNARRSLPKMPALLFFGIIFFYSLFQEREFLFKTTPFGACRAMYGTSPFPEAKEISKYIEKHADKNSAIAVLGSEPEIYFYSKRRASIPYLYMYPLMEAQPYAVSMQDELIGNMERNPPEYVVFVNYGLSWNAPEDIKRHIFGWFEGFKAKHYEVAGVADIISSKRTEYRWGDEARVYEPESNEFIYVFKRR